jgi:hypothetical protein
MSVEAIGAVLHNSKAKGTTKLVLIGIANHEGDGGSWPSIATLCKYANCSDTTVRSAIKWLVKHNEVEVIRQGGGNAKTRADRRPNLYRVLVTAHGVKTGAPRGVERGELSGERGELFEVTGSRGVDPNRPIEPSILEPSIKTSFEVFWDNYPRHSAKPKAATAFAKAIERGNSAATIIEGAARFADDPNRIDEFTPLPATWLNQERWADDPLPQRQDRGHARLNKLEQMTKRLNALRELP